MRAALVTFIGLLGIALASPTKRSSCLTDAAAQRVANNFQSLISDYSNASAAAFLTTNFSDYSDSVNELINNGCPNGPQPLGSATFSSLESFQAGQGSQPNIPFERGSILRRTSSSPVLNVGRGNRAIARYDPFLSFLFYEEDLADHFYFPIRTQPMARM